jgi:hypothetical protein
MQFSLTISLSNGVAPLAMSDGGAQNKKNKTEKIP